MHDKYQGHDQVHNANGEGMKIDHIGHAIVTTPFRDIHLRNVLHAPETSKNLLSVHCIAIDNRVYLEFHPYFFLIRDEVTRNILYRGRCVHGLYPLIPQFRSFNKQVCGVIKLSSERWHARLGHPSFSIVQQVLRNNQLPCAGERRLDTICDSCQRAKYHQLPYPISTSISTKPLHLIFPDVWGPTPSLVGRHTYYVSFIDDYSKFTWLYLLKNRSNVFQVFRQFQALVERQLDSKILTVQSDWGGEYEKPNSFFKTLGISHHVSCPHAHQQNGSAKRKHRHIVEVGLSLLAGTSMPLKFWDEAYLTTVHLINMLSSRVINNDTPMHMLFHT